MQMQLLENNSIARKKHLFGEKCVIAVTEPLTMSYFHSNGSFSS